MDTVTGIATITVSCVVIGLVASFATRKLYTNKVAKIVIKLLLFFVVPALVIWFLVMPTIQADNLYKIFVSFCAPSVCFMMSNLLPEVKHDR